jgi:heptosyltransferase I
LIEPRRILLVRLSHLGDLVHALPVFHALRARYPRAQLGWVLQPEFAGLVEGLPGLDRSFHFDRRGGARAWPRLAAELAAFGADLAVDAQGNAKSALVSLASGAPRRTGLAREDWREPFAAHALTESAPPLGSTRAAHAMERMEHLARHLGGSDALRRDPGLSQVELARGAAELVGRLGSARAPVLLSLSPPADLRAWPAERWAQLARLLAREGRGVLLISGPAEAELGALLSRELAGAEAVSHWVGQRGLRLLAAFFSAAAQHGARLVACDTGPMHLAAACGLPVLALAGPQDPLRTGPWPIPGPGSRHLVLAADQPPPCMPCLARRCDHARGPVCMERIRPEDVLAALSL